MWHLGGFFTELCQGERALGGQCRKGALEQDNDKLVRAKQRELMRLALPSLNVRSTKTRPVEQTFSPGLPASFSHDSSDSHHPASAKSHLSKGYA